MSPAPTAAVLGFEAGGRVRLRAISPVIHVLPGLTDIAFLLPFIFVLRSL